MKNLINSYLHRQASTKLCEMMSELIDDLVLSLYKKLHEINFRRKQNPLLGTFTQIHAASKAFLLMQVMKIEHLLASQIMGMVGR